MRRRAERVLLLCRSVVGVGSVAAAVKGEELGVGVGFGTGTEAENGAALARTGVAATAGTEG